MLFPTTLKKKKQIITEASIDRGFSCLLNFAITSAYYYNPKNAVSKFEYHEEKLEFTIYGDVQI